MYLTLSARHDDCHAAALQYTRVQLRCSFLLRQVSLLALRSPGGPLDPVDAQLRTLLKEDAGKITPEAAAPIVRSVIQALRLYACVFRSSVRRFAAVARLEHHLESAAMPRI